MEIGAPFQCVYVIRDQRIQSRISYDKSKPAEGPDGEIGRRSGLKIRRE
jgi:hypothetical protein